MAVVALGAFESRKWTHSLHYLTSHFRNTQGASRVAAHPPVSPCEPLGRQGAEEWSGAEAGHEGPGEGAGSTWTGDPPAAPPPARVRGALSPREQRGCGTRALNLPRLGSTRRRRQGARGTTWCRLRLHPARLLLRPPGAAPSRPGAHHAAPRGTAPAATHPWPPRATLRTARSLFPLCCASAHRDALGRAVTQGPRRGSHQVPSTLPA